MQGASMRCTIRPRIIASLCAAASTLALAQPAGAACRVTDFTDKTLTSLNEAQRLSFVSQMTQTEYDKLRRSQPGSANYHELIAKSANAAAARRAAQSKIADLGVENIDDFRRVWASDFLTDEELRRYTDCVTNRQPGLFIAGRPDGPGKFNISFSHLTPIGVEKITTKLVAAYNVANVKQLEDFLTVLGPRDNYPAQTFALQLIDPGKRAVLVMRAGWETPKFVYIPVYPTADYFKQR